MSALIRNGRVEADDYLDLGLDDPLPDAAARVIVPLERWARDGAALETGSRTVGIRVPNTADIETIWSQLATRPLLALEFPAFGDGRAYSQARLLRDRYGYRGEIRAIGQAVVRDQLQGMSRVGINAFALRADQNPETCLDGLSDFDVAYQPATDILPIVNKLRLA
ncbi:MAG: DUF934 domain-containing protein [Bradyrhizobium sp.]